MRRRCSPSCRRASSGSARRTRRSRRCTRDDRGEEEVVAAALAATVAGPRRAVAGADVDEVGFGIVGDAVPRRAAAAGTSTTRRSQVLAAISIAPSSKRLRRIAGHDVEPPRLLAGVGVVGGDVAAHAVEFAAAVADDHLALDDARRAGDGVVAADRRGLHDPVHVPGRGVEGDEAAVEQPDVDAGPCRGRRRGSPARSMRRAPPSAKPPLTSAGSHRHFRVPVRASMANTTLHVEVP